MAGGPASNGRPGQRLGGRAARVRRTGIALVHEGELVLPASGSEAEADVVLSDSRTVVNYYFPVEIEVVAGGTPVDVDGIVDAAMDRLNRSLEGLGA
jgi:hypothetical protein